MKILGRTADSDISTVYLAELSGGRMIEFVESVHPPIPRSEKWVLIISTLCGCPVGCGFCDSGDFYKGKLSKEEMFAQIDYAVRKYYPDGCIPQEKFKIQFARMGDPVLNPAVLDVLEEFDERYEAPGFIPSLSTIASAGCGEFIRKLKDIKDRKYAGRFQLQFSIHTTDPEQRDKLIPVRKLSFQEMAKLGNKFIEAGDKKISLNFALAEDNVVDPAVLRVHFDPRNYLVKLTPVNPTVSAEKNKIRSLEMQGMKLDEIINGLESAGYETILSIGELEENRIGSNCGQVLKTYLDSGTISKDSYSYDLISGE